MTLCNGILCPLVSLCQIKDTNLENTKVVYVANLVTKTDEDKLMEEEENEMVNLTF